MSDAKKDGRTYSVRETATGKEFELLAPLGHHRS